MCFLITLTTSNRLYRILLWSLPGIFFLSVVGIPVIISSCPMTAGTSRYLCTSCFDPSGSGAESLGKVRSTSCCATIVVAERNSTEFLGPSGDPSISPKAISSGQNCPVICGRLFDTPEFTCVLHPSLSPPGDIPIFISSLRI
jgi:hypothetical protein